MNYLYIHILFKFWTQNGNIIINKKEGHSIFDCGPLSRKSTSVNKSLNYILDIL